MIVGLDSDKTLMRQARTGLGFGVCLLDLLLAVVLALPVLVVLTIVGGPGEVPPLGDGDCLVDLCAGDHLPALGMFVSDSAYRTVFVYALHLHGSAWR